LQQNAFRDDDQFTSLKKQDLLLKMILHFNDRALRAHAAGAQLKAIFSAPVRERIARAKYLSEDDLGVFADIEAEIETQLVSETTSVEQAEVSA
jgi:V/A-type H+-transporting ATPase subunit A